MFIFRVCVDMIAKRRMGKPLVGLCDGTHSFFLTEFQNMEMPDVLEQRNMLFCVQKHDIVQEDDDCGFMHKSLDFLYNPLSDDHNFNVLAFLSFVQQSSCVAMKTTISQYEQIDFSLWQRLLDYLGAQNSLLQKLETFATQTKWKHPATAFSAFCVFPNCKTQVLDSLVAKALQFKKPFASSTHFAAYKVAANCGSGKVKLLAPLDSSSLKHMQVPDSILDLFDDGVKAVFGGPICATIFNPDVNLMLPCIPLNVCVRDPDVIAEFAERLEPLGYVFLLDNVRHKIMAIAPKTLSLLDHQQQRSLCITTDDDGTPKLNMLWANLNCDEAIAFIDRKNNHIAIHATFSAKLAWEQKRAHFGQTTSTSALLQRHYAGFLLDNEQIKNLLKKGYEFPLAAKHVEHIFLTHFTADDHLKHKEYTIFDKQQQKQNTTQKKRKRN